MSPCTKSQMGVEAVLNSPPKLKGANNLTARSATDDTENNEAEMGPQGDMEEKKATIPPAVGGKGKITKGKRKKAAPKQKKRKARTQQTWKVENITAIRRAHDHTPQNKRWQFAVKWAGCDARSWHYAETLGNYPLLCEQLANAIDSESVYLFPPQDEGEDEGAEVNETMASRKSVYQG